MSNLDSSQAILFETRGHIAIITFNLPKQLNALTQEQYYHVGQLLRQIATMDDIYVTVLTAKGRFFSAGANVQAATSNTDSSGNPSRKAWLQTFVSHNLEIGHAFSTHPKILVTALNGPVVGLSAALIAYSDFIYAMPHTFLLTPFSSLGLVAEGGASHTFVQRMGISKANEALIMSRRISCEELVQCGFVNKVFEGVQGEDKPFLEKVLKEVDERLSGGHLNPRSLFLIKESIRRPLRQADEQAHLQEVMVGLDGFVKGIPQQEFAAVATGKKRHKL